MMLTVSARVVLFTISLLNLAALGYGHITVVTALFSWQLNKIDPLAIDSFMMLVQNNVVIYGDTKTISYLRSTYPTTSQRRTYVYCRYDDFVGVRTLMKNPASPAGSSNIRSKHSRN
jgi:hypothetical protein